VSHKTILVVDDDEDIRELLKDALEDAGYVVRVAENGREGLDSLQKLDHPCMVLLDLIMPVMTGNELYEAMQADPALASIPVVVSTSDPRRAPAGAELLNKPVDLRTLMRVVERHC
jgi:CheY-like chemotaxis protein